LFYRYRDIGRPSTGIPTNSTSYTGNPGASAPYTGNATNASSAYTANPVNTNSTYNRKRAKEKLYLDFQVKAAFNFLSMFIVD
jgi:hypothetical protein